MLWSFPDLENIIEFAKHAGKGQEGTKPKTDADTDTKENEEKDNIDEDDEEEEEVEEIIGADLSEESVKAAANLDDVLSTLMKNFSEGIDYFQVLVQVFQQVMLSKEHPYLKNFYMIIPALCINYVDTIRVSKDKMDKVKRQGARQTAYFTDDGFAIGIAYILAILKQGPQFESLHWFDTMYNKYGEEQKTTKAELSSVKNKRGRSDKDTISELEIRSGRIETMKKEFRLLFYSLDGAQVFFKDRDPDEDDEEEKKA